MLSSSDKCGKWVITSPQSIVVPDTSGTEMDDATWRISCHFRIRLRLHAQPKDDLDCSATRCSCASCVLEIFCVYRDMTPGSPHIMGDYGQLALKRLENYMVEFDNKNNPGCTLSRIPFFFFFSSSCFILLSFPFFFIFPFESSRNRWSVIHHIATVLLRYGADLE